MKTMKIAIAEKYLDALEASIEANDNESIVLLEPFTTNLYHRIYAINNAESGEKRDQWERPLQRVKAVISELGKRKGDLW